ncbi:MAG: 16S rRNA (adenine(1518)-N(6)/adenine(1519)-N(6))-dimethyltransferase RsmA [Alphaproteobacteria bacterium]|nr:16S rRNA (adenine(1518)-N(6)/adenine(1519)-N(6))-dimethyltransferase RsmA [Alphaproteobacteria bacterium]
MPNLDIHDALNQLPPLREVIEEHDLVATKKLGQNFLLDRNITDKIAHQAGDVSECTVFEIGPGPGGLTRSLLHAGAKKVVAIEFDKRAVKALQSLVEASQGKFEVIHADALNTNILELADGPKAIVANLPYNVATPLLVGWLTQIHQDENTFERMILMFQKEVAQRITSPVGEKHYGRLGVLSQWLCDTSIAFDLPPSVFSPPPKVTSSVVSFYPKKNLSNKPSFKSVEKATEAGFGKRRKMIRQSMKEYQPFFEEIGIKETLRAENLTVNDFVNLAEKKSL